jgi:hypothetical protein
MANFSKIPNYITHNATQKKIIYIFNFNTGMQGLFTSNRVSKAGNGQEISPQTDTDLKNLTNHISYVSKPDVAGRYRPPTHVAGLVKNFKENIGNPKRGNIYKMFGVSNMLYANDTKLTVLAKNDMNHGPSGASGKDGDW